MIFDHERSRGAGGWVFSFFSSKKRRSNTGQTRRRRLYIPEIIYRRIINQCMEERPLEACGLLVGASGHVTAAYATDNEHRSPILYKVDERQLWQVLRESENRKQELVAIYHSHVKTEPVPSRTDIAQANWPEAFYLIISLAQHRPHMRAWRIVDGQVTEHQVVVQKEVPGAWADLRQAVQRAAAEPERHSDIP